MEVINERKKFAYRYCTGCCLEYVHGDPDKRADAIRWHAITLPEFWKNPLWLPYDTFLYQQL